MHISEKLVKAFQKTYEAKFGQNIPAKEAEQDLSDLANIIKLTNKTERKTYENQSK